MSEAQENELSAWMSTYGIITAERILERYQIRLQHEELFTALKNPNSFYHKLLKVPLKNVLNGIILQQTQDYQVYAQKLFIDYLMSGESTRAEDAPGGFTREDIEKERLKLVEMGQRFRQCEMNQKKLIAASQKALIKQAQLWSEGLSSTALKIKSQFMNKNVELIKPLINALLVHPQFTDQTTINLKAEYWTRVEKIHGESLANDLKQRFADEVQKLNESNTSLENSLSEFLTKADDMGLTLRTWRSDFQSIILQAQNLLKMLPDYHANEAQDQENKETLFFDSTLGDKREN
ncbi:MAG: hypothetical protein H0U73_00150 [Tatlockia sp.]|nr:hypothetical protein [Tatlockia sp.]